MWTMGLNQSVIGVNKNLSLINLNLITGHIGKPGSGPFSLTGQPNAMGGREVGGLSNILPAHRNLADAKDRQNGSRKILANTIRNYSTETGLTATEMFDALNDGKLKAIWILCTNPLVSMPDVRIAEEGLKKAKFVVVQEVSSTAETLQYADVVLPAAAWSEKEGTMTNADRRISYLNKITEARVRRCRMQKLFAGLHKKMGYNGFGYTNSSEIYAEHCALTEGTRIDISGLSYDILKDETYSSMAIIQNKQRITERQDYSLIKNFTRPPKKQLFILFRMPMKVSNRMPTIPFDTNNRPHPRPVAHNEQNGHG